MWILINDFSFSNTSNNAEETGTTSSGEETPEDSDVELDMEGKSCNTYNLLWLFYISRTEQILVFYKQLYVSYNFCKRIHTENPSSGQWKKKNKTLLFYKLKKSRETTANLLW